MAGTTREQDATELAELYAAAKTGELGREYGRKSIPFLLQLESRGVTDTFNLSFKQRSWVSDLFKKLQAARAQTTPTEE